MEGGCSVNEVQLAGDPRLGWTITYNHQMCHCSIKLHFLFINTCLDIQHKCLVAIFRDILQGFINGLVLPGPILGNDEVGFDLLRFFCKEFPRSCTDPTGEPAVPHNVQLIGEEAAAVESLDVQLRERIRDLCHHGKAIACQLHACLQVPLHFLSSITCGEKKENNMKFFEVNLSYSP